MDDFRVIDLAHESKRRLGLLCVDPPLGRVSDRDGNAQSVEPRVMQVLVRLAEVGGATVSREELRDSCWAGRVTSDDAVDRVIAQIRRLGQGIGQGSFTLETIPKVGYRLVDHEAPTEPGDFAAPAGGVSRRVLLVGAAAGAVALGAGAFLYFGRDGARAEAHGPLTLAVLPFDPESSSAAAQGFARQLASEVRSDLSRVVDIRVIAETSSRSAAEEGGDAREVGRRLDADLLLEAQVRGSGPARRVNVALVDVETGTQIWTESIAPAGAGPSAARLAVSGAVIQQLAGLITLTPGAAEPPVRRPDPQSYALVSEANRLLEEIRTTSMRGRREDALALGDRADSLARRALAIDPQDSAAFAVLATLARNGWTTALAAQPLSTEQRVEQSIAIVRQALIADPRNPGALTQLGDYYRRFAFRWSEAENLFRRALAIDPSLVEAHWSYGYMLGTTGRAVEGLDQALSVFELDPRNPFRRVALPRLLYLCGQRGLAMRRYDVELAEQPDNLFLLRELYFSFLSEGNANELTGLRARITRDWANRSLTPEIRALLARIDAGLLAVNGDRTRLKALVDADVADFDSPARAANATPQGRARDDLPYIFAIEYAWAGEPERSLDMLERALVAKSLYWPATLPFGPAPFPPSVRNHPRFAPLWQRDPGLRELIARRRRALAGRQMAGFTSDGRRVAAAIPAALAARVRAALARR